MEGGGGGGGRGGGGRNPRLKGREVYQMWKKREREAAFPRLQELGGEVAEILQQKKVGSTMEGLEGMGKGSTRYEKLEVQTLLYPLPLIWAIKEDVLYP